jgi:DnaJ family protein C protein 11
MVPATNDDDPVTTEEEKEIERLLEGDFYDVLCLPRGRGGALTREEVRRAYHRMFLLFHPETYPEAMQGIARRQFERAQEGFEVLIDEARRRAYDRGIREGLDDEEDEEMERSGWKESSIGSEVGVRADASRGVHGCRPLDFTVGHSSSMAVPRLASPFIASLASLGLTTTAPSLTLSSSIYGIIPPMSAFPIHLLSSPHQPLRPATSPRYRLLQLVDSKLSPVIAASLTHDIVNSSATTDTTWLGTRAEYALDILPNLAPSIRLFHSLNLLPDSKAATILETSIKGRSWWSSSDEAGVPPRAAVGVHHPFAFGTAFARVDTGDWSFTPETCRFLTSAAVAEAKKVSYADFPLQVAPTVELGFTTASDIPSTGSWDDTPESTRSQISLLNTPPHSTIGVWTASTALNPLNNLTTSIRYTTPSLSLLSSSHLELDLSTSTLHPSTLSLRHLNPLTTTINIGLELSLSRFSTHLSIHITRLNQRFSLPLFFPPIDHLKPQTLFLASAMPFLALAAYKFLSRSSSKRKTKQQSSKEDLPLDTFSPAVQAAIAHRREEADHLTGLLAHPIATRQKHHASHNNLVILSAKFGLAASSNITLNTTPTPSLPATFHPDEEIADVTVALAALVDDQTGGLWIPEGVRKGCIPGFWDPAPGREKLLLVRYSWRGREDVIAVRGDEELVLPPR